VLLVVGLGGGENRRKMYLLSLSPLVALYQQCIFTGLFVMAVN